MLRVALVLRSTEVHPVFAKFVFKPAVASGAIALRCLHALALACLHASAAVSNACDACFQTLHIQQASQICGFTQCTNML